MSPAVEKCVCPRPPIKKGVGERDVPVRFAGVAFTPGAWLYADENEGKCPQAANWCDAITPNLAGKQVFQCPQRAGNDGGFAFNAKLAGKSLSAIPPDTVMIFESSKGWNFTGGADDVISRPPRTRSPGSCATAFERVRRSTCAQGLTARSRSVRSCRS